MGLIGTTSAAGDGRLGATGGKGRHEDRWDAVVIGAGFAGLVCAAYLAAAGRRVLVVEQHDVGGGNGHVFRRRRAYEFDVGVHYLGDCGPDGVLPRILGGLGLGKRIEFRQMDPDGFDRIVLPSLTVDVPTRWSRYEERLLHAFPDEARQISTFVDTCTTSAARIRAHVLGERAAAAPAGQRAGEAWHRRSLTELFDHCGLSPRARTVLAAQAGNYGSGPQHTPVGTHAAMMDHFLRGAYYPVGGGQHLVASIIEVIESHGGELRTRCRAERIVVDRGRAVGVRLGDGSEVRAPVVVSNADYRRTVLELIGPDAGLPARVVRNAEEAVMRLPFAVLYVGLNRPLSDRRNANMWWFAGEDIEAAYAELHRGQLDEVPFVFLSFASIKDERCCPPGHSNFQVMTLCPPDYAYWGVGAGPATGNRYRREPRYRDRKERLMSSMLRAAEAALGPFQDAVTHLELATPLTHERYLLSTGGTPYGMTDHRPGIRTAVGGLYVVGQNTQYGVGVGPVAVSGIACAAEILERPLLSEVSRGAVLADTDLMPHRPPAWDALAVSRGRARRAAPGLARLGR
ncbi:NAD(P)/FAD-dependent oxidoreductase [Planosporangium thailandense]|uniref:NAD(P)/FAD-dependent oxidoreductase n=2 Tax=Planosporangium thailandense TaxID=765197 RepID=A0ABX0XZN8_9ACTN|nr:NAD(P)/FAD-dependent oxidoreductase [Planosporangium thailandense]